MSNAYSYNSEDLKSLGKSVLLGLSGVAGAYITTGIWPEVSLVLKIGEWSINLIPVIAAGVPVVVNALRLFFRGSKV